MEETEKNKMEWVEIIEPRTKEHMYANLTTGECVWDPPPGVHVKRTTDSQWWELFDHKTSRFYYYNAATQRTVWHRPNNCDIIPLAKLQTLKQNTQVKSPGQESTSSSSSPTNRSAAVPTEGATAASVNTSRSTGSNSSSATKKESVATQTPSRSSHHSRSCDVNGGAGSSSGTRRSVEKVSSSAEPVTSSSSQRKGATSSAQTKTTSTSPMASPRQHRRHHHHHHHHHQCSSSKNAHQSDEEGTATAEGTSASSTAGREPISAQVAAQQLEQRKARRGVNGNWYTRHGKSQDSGRSSDSSTLSLSVAGSLAKRSESCKLSSGTPGTGRRTLDPPLEFGSTASTPMSGRRKASLELSRQRSLDSTETSQPAANSSTTPTPIRSSNKPSDLFYRDGSLSRSLSFMQQRRPQTAVRGQGPLFDLWSPQREHYFGTGGSEMSSATGVDSLCTPMINRKQRSLESGTGSGGGKPRESSKLHQSPQLHHQPQRPLGASASFRLTGSSGSFGRSDPLRPLGGSSFASDSSPSPKREKDRGDSLRRNRSHRQTEQQQQLQLQQLVRSGDSSPHSAGDSGLATTGSRASQDSSSVRHTKATATAKSSPPKTSATAAVSTAPDTSEASGGGIYDPVPLYSNIDYNYYLDPKAQAHLLPLQQYILEQAKLSGYRFGDSSPLTEDGGAVGARAAFRSDDEEDEHSNRQRIRLPAHLHADHNDDSDDFADDEGMSNVEDSSSLEYLDESQYLEEDDHYTQFLMAPVPPQRQQSKSTASPPHHFGPSSSHHQQQQQQHHRQQEIIVEPEYTEADPGLISGGAAAACGTYRSLPDGPVSSSSPVHHSSGLTSSLRPRPKESMIPQSSSLYSPVMDRAGPFGLEGFRPASESSPSLPKSASLQRSPSSLGHPNKAIVGAVATTPTDGDIEKYAQSNLNIHKKGIFRKNLSIRDMLSWSKDAIRKPMLPLEDKQLKKEACDLFKLVQIYMGDRKCKPGMTCNSVALELCNQAWNKPALRDELYLHICRQTTENPRKESLRRGWELMAICLYFFPPSPKLEPYLDGYINRHRDPGLNFTEVDKWPIHVQVSHYATISCRRLMRIGASGRRQERKPTLEEIEQARLQIFRPSMFGNTLDEIMTVQRDRFPHRKLPWIQTTLSEEILRLHGAQTEGIFRVPADVDEVNSLKNRMDQWEVGHVSDAHVPASLLKLWYRELYESLIPDELYPECVQYCSDPERAVAVVHRLPEFHRLVLSYLIRFLQIFSQTEVSSVTKMDASNLAMVMAPNCLRCNASDPKIIFDNARKEMAFIRTLIQHLDTSFMEGVV